MRMNIHIQSYNNSLTSEDKAICDMLQHEIDSALSQAESKIWHGHPVWFLDGNPVVGYSKLKNSVQLLFWSGQSFEEDGLEPEGTFKAAQKRYTSKDQMNTGELRKWLKKAATIQWDYKNIVKKKCMLS